MSHDPLNIPMIEDPGKGPWIRRAMMTMYRLLRHPVAFWDDVYRGEGLIAPLALTYAFSVCGVVIFLLAARAGIGVTHRMAGGYSGLALTGFYTTFPAQIIVFMLNPLIECFALGGATAGILSLMNTPSGLFRQTSRLAIYSYVAVLPIRILVVGLAVYMSANPIGTMALVAPGGAFGSREAVQHGQMILAAILLVSTIPWVALRVLDVVAIKKTLGKQVTWAKSVTAGIAGAIAAMLVAFLIGQCVTGLTVEWLMHLDRNKPLSTVDSVLVAPMKLVRPDTQ